MMSIRYIADERRCVAIYNTFQQRILVRNRIRRRIIHISHASSSFNLVLHGLQGDVAVPMLRMVPLSRWRVNHLLQQKLLRMHPAYQKGKNTRSFLKLWRDYNRLLSHSRWPLLEYGEWMINQSESLKICRKDADSSCQHPVNSGLIHHQRLLVLPWHDRDGRMYPNGGLLGAYNDSKIWFCLLRDGDQLAAHAIESFRLSLLQHPEAMVYYADEDRLSSNGKRHSPHFKPAWNPELLYRDPDYSHCWLIRSDLFLKAWHRLERLSDPCSFYGLLLEITARCQPEQIIHIPEVLYHRFEYLGETRGNLQTAAAVQEFLRRQGCELSVDLHPQGGHRLRWSLPEPVPMVSVIIPTRDRVQLLRKCIDSLAATLTLDIPCEIIIIDNDSCEPESLAYLADLENMTRTTVLRRSGEFNYAALNNEAASLAHGEILLFMNNDVEAIDSGWLRLMVAEACRPEVGAVGARLLFDDGTVQHAGVLLGIGGVAGHAHKYIPGDAPGYQLRLQLSHQLSAVTAAVLVVRRSVFDEVSGFDAACFAVNYNDVDFCLRVMARGYRNIYCADAVLIHHESRSRGVPETPEAYEQWQQESQMMLCRWGSLIQNDPFYSPHLTLVDEDFSLALRPPPFSSRAGFKSIPCPL